MGEGHSRSGLGGAETMTQGERIAKLETKVDRIEATVDSMDKKLDDIIAGRNKGLGAFTLAASLMGTGIIGILGRLFGWFHT